MMPNFRFPLIVFSLLVLAVVLLLPIWMEDSSGAGVIESLWFRYLSGGAAVLGLVTVIWVGSLLLRRGLSWVKILTATMVLLLSLACLDMAAYARWPLDVPWLRATASAVATLWLFAFVFMIVRWLLGRGGGTLGVAQLVIDESIRRREAIIVLGLLLLLLPTLPFVLGADDQPLRHRIQSFLSFSLTSLSFVVSVLTIFLACGTLSREITDRQVLINAVKPLARWRYFLGKWFGVTAVSGMLLVVFSTGIFTAATLYLPSLPAANEFDARAIETEVLVARKSHWPRPETAFEDGVNQTLSRWVEGNSRRIEELGELAASKEGRVQLTREQMFKLGVERARKELLVRAKSEWLNILPLESETYIFDGLDTLRQTLPSSPSAAKLNPSDHLQLRYDLRGTGPITRSRVRLELKVFPFRTNVELVMGKAQTFSIPPWFIGEDGRLKLEIRNALAEQQPVRFVANNGPELLYPAGSFLGNFSRVVLFLWIQMAFLAMLGLTAASFINLPVATIFSLTIWMLASGSNFLYESADLISLQAHDHQPSGEEGATEEEPAFIVRTIAYLLGGPLRQYSIHDPIGELTRGRIFPSSDLFTAFFWIFIVWTGGLAVIGALIYSRRELANAES